MQQKRWNIRSADEEAVRKLQEQLKIHPVLCRLLVLRGITNYDAAHLFFRPKLEHLHDPFLMKDMDKAIDRIDQAMEQGQRILIYGDYDVDGTTAVSLVYKYFASFYEEVHYYQPDRYLEGYGVSRQGIEYAADNDCQLIIALDCGIKAHEQVAAAKAKGIDFIICDHHLPDADLPDAIAVLDPKRSDCSYPYKELCGCGIGFKLVQAYAGRHNLSEGEVYDLMDLLAISIAADIVPITGENRVMMHFGLQLINTRPSAGIRAMLHHAKVDKQLVVSDLVFTLAPRINAAGRMDHANRAVELMLEENPDEAIIKAESIEGSNAERKNLDRDITAEALEMIASNPNQAETSSSVLYHPDWHKGVIGIVASRVIERYYKPTIILTKSNGKVVGSARSVKDFDLYEALQACEDDLIQFGGHKYAAGMTMEESSIDAFRQHFDEAVSATIEDASRVPVVEIDGILELSEVTEKFYQIIEQMAPFGPGNRRPVFATYDVFDSGNSRIVKKDHLKLEIKKNGNYLRGIAFGQADKMEFIQRSVKFGVCYQLQINEWNGRRSVEMMVKDIGGKATNVGDE